MRLEVPYGEIIDFKNNDISSISSVQPLFSALEYNATIF